MNISAKVKKTVQAKALVGFLSVASALNLMGDDLIIPMDFVLPMPDFSYLASKCGLAGEEPYSILNGNFVDGGLLLNHWNRQPVVLDMGSPKKLTRLLTSPSTTIWTTLSRTQNISYQVSSNGEDWVEIHNTGKEGFPLGKVAHEIDLSGLSGRYRFAKVSAPDNQGISELELRTTDMTLSIAAPITWDVTAKKTQATAVGLPECPDGVYVEGKVARLEPAETKVYVCAAKMDYGIDLAAWRKNGQQFVAEGVVATPEGASYSLLMTGLPSGSVYVRAFAECGDEVVAAPRTWRFASGTVAAARTDVYVNGNNADHADGAKWTDGKLNTMPSSRSGWIVFDLRGITGSGQYASAIRFWGADFGERMLPATVEFAYDDEGVTWPDASIVLEDDVRTVRYASGLPEGLVWQPSTTIGEYSKLLFPSFPGMDLPIAADWIDGMLKTYRKTGRMPRYMKFTTGNMYLNELEVRVNKIPPAPGLILIIQ